MIAHKAERQHRPLAAVMTRLAAGIVVAAATGIMLSAATRPVRLVGVTAQPGVVLIEASDPVAYSVTRPDPQTVLVDLRNVSVTDAHDVIAPEGSIAAVKVEQVTAEGSAVARVRVSLDRPMTHSVRSSRNTIRVELGQSRDNSAGAIAVPEEARSPARASSAVPATVIEQVQTGAASLGTRVTLIGDGHLAPASMSESEDSPRRLVLDFANVGTTAPKVTTINSPLIKRVRVGTNSTEPLVTRVVMEIADGARYRVERTGDEGRNLAVVFEKAQSANTVMMPPVADSAGPSEPEAPITMQQALANGAALAPTSAPIDAMSALETLKTAAPAAGPGSAPAARPASSTAAVTPVEPAAKTSAHVAPPRTRPVVASPPVERSGAQVLAALQQQPGAQTQPPAAPATPAAPGQTPAAPAPPTGLPASGDGPRQYTGHTVSLDFQGVDLRAVLRSFAEISGLNMVIDPDVQGTVDIVLTDVPWDQALDVILRGNQLDYTVDGTIVRIAKLDTLKKEQESRQALAKAAADAGTLEVQTYALSYARASNAAPLIKKAALSPRGDVQIDERTNTLIITDLASRIETARALLTTLDRPEPQVEIEARVVATNRDFSRAIGVEWGLNGRVSPEIGNTTGLAFPNRGSIGGRQSTQGAEGTDVRANPLDTTGTVVGLPASPSFGAIGLAMGAVNGAFNLDLALSALESSGKVRILSTPRVTTQNNVKAEMTQGVQIPYQTEANNTVTVQFKDAALTLRVTPQITAANTVIMQVELENAGVGEVIGAGINQIPTINTQRALTTVQVNDGATTIIGGVFISEERFTSDRIPKLHRLPLIGWLFKRDTTTDDSRELLIFITPRILKG